MKVLVASVACGTGDEVQLRMALESLRFWCEKSLESGENPPLFEVPDDTKRIDVKVSKAE